MLCSLISQNILQSTIITTTISSTCMAMDTEYQTLVYIEEQEEEVCMIHPLLPPVDATRTTARTTTTVAPASSSVILADDDNALHGVLLPNDDNLDLSIDSDSPTNETSLLLPRRVCFFIPCCYKERCCLVIVFALTLLIISCSLIGSMGLLGPPEATVLYTATTTTDDAGSDGDKPNSSSTTTTIVHQMIRYPRGYSVIMYHVEPKKMTSFMNSKDPPSHNQEGRGAPFTLSSSSSSSGSSGFTLTYANLFQDFFSTSITQTSTRIDEWNFKGDGEIPIGIPFPIPVEIHVRIGSRFDDGEVMVNPSSRPTIPAATSTSTHFDQSWITKRCGTYLVLTQQRERAKKVFDGLQVMVEKTWKETDTPSVLYGTYVDEDTDDTEKSSKYNQKLNDTHYPKFYGVVRYGSPPPPNTKKTTTTTMDGILYTGNITIPENYGLVTYEVVPISQEAEEEEIKTNYSSNPSSSSSFSSHLLGGRQEGKRIQNNNNNNNNNLVTVRMIGYVGPTPSTSSTLEFGSNHPLYNPLEGDTNVILLPPEHHIKISSTTIDSSSSGSSSGPPLYYYYTNDPSKEEEKEEVMMMRKAQQEEDSLFLMTTITTSRRRRRRRPSHHRRDDDDDDDDDDAMSTTNMLLQNLLPQLQGRRLAVGRYTVVTKTPEKLAETIVQYVQNWTDSLD